MSYLPPHLSKITICDVTLRDGLQSLKTILPTITKLKIMDALVEAGVKELEVTSFVNPKVIPQLADAESVFKHALTLPVISSVLVANQRGYERAIDAGVTNINAVVSISETYNKKSFNRGLQESINTVRLMCEHSRKHQITLELALSNAFHCFTEGYISPSQVLAVLTQFENFDIASVGLADTTGFAAPDKTFALLETLQQKYPQQSFSMHVHDTQGRAVVNSYAGLQLGIVKHDAALGGIGGSPFTPGVGGNLSLEVFAIACAASELETGINIEKLGKARTLLAEAIS